MTTVRMRNSGELDMATAEGVERQVGHVLAGEPAPERVILDLGERTFCDSSGIDVLQFTDLNPADIILAENAGGVAILRR